MSLKHQIKEEETLLAYFRQMLTDSEDEINYEQSGPQSEIATPPASAQSIHEPLMAPKEPSLEPQMQLEVQEEPSVQTQTLTLAAPKSLQTLLESVDEHKAEVIETTAQVESVVDTVTQSITEQETALETQEQTQSVVDKQSDVVTATQTVDEVVTKTSALDEEALAKEALEAQQWEASLNATAVVETEQETAQQQVGKAKFDPDNWENIHTEEEFQTLFFTVQGVRFAVPLIDLGNIIECGKITQIFGKPAWYMGMTDCRGDKINIVDTLLWVKPEIGESPDKYPYLISLSKSNWALGCDVLEGNRTLTRSQVKWRVTAGSRPWLAGIVKDQMCALLHVEALIALFEKGMDFGKLKEKFGDIS